MIETALLIGMVVVALGIIGLVLLQQGKGADMGASFGSGASQTLFGSQGSGNFLTRSTWILAFVFFGLCLGLAVIARDKAEQAGKIDFETPEPVQQEIIAPESEIPMAEDDAEQSDIPAVEESGSAEGEMPQPDTPDMPMASESETVEAAANESDTQ